jgi:pentatricopeptide repeat protein
MITTDMEITPAIRTIMMSACAHLGQFERALNLMDELEMAQQLPNVRTFNVLLLAASTSPLWMKVSILRSTANAAISVSSLCKQQSTGVVVQRGLLQQTHCKRSACSVAVRASATI